MAIEATDIYSHHTEEHDFETAQLSDHERSPLRSRRMIVAKARNNRRRSTMSKGR